MTLSKQGAFAWAGGGKSGAVVDLWAANRFSEFPSQGSAPPPGNADAGPVITGEEFGSPGAYLINGILIQQDYYVRVLYGGQAYWGACPAGSLDGDTGGGGGGGNDGSFAFPFTFNSVNPTTVVFPLGYAPDPGDLIYGFSVSITQAFNGLTPSFDLMSGTGNEGVLATAGLPPISLATADTVLNPGFGTNTATGWDSAILTGALTNGLPVINQVITVTESFDLQGIISQDGTNNAPVSALLTPAGAPAIGGPGLSITSANNQFTFSGSPSGSASPETFTLVTPGGPYTTVAGVCAAMAAATGSVSGERFDTICSVTPGGSRIHLAMVAPGAAANGNVIGPGTNDVSVSLGFTGINLFEGGVGGASGATQGTGVIYLKTSTPAT